MFVSALASGFDPWIGRGTRDLSLGPSRLLCPTNAYIMVTANSNLEAH